MTPHQWLRAAGKVPLISGAHLFYSKPTTAEYAESMLKLHTAWRKVGDLPKGEAAIAEFDRWVAAEECPKYISLEIAKHGLPRPSDVYIDGDGYEYAEGEHDWLETVGITSGDGEIIDGLFSNDNYTSRPDFDQARHTLPQDADRAAYSDAAHLHILRNPESWWRQTVESEQRRSGPADLGLKANDPFAANEGQRRAIVLLLYALYLKHHRPDHRIEQHDELMALLIKGLGRRLLLLGGPGTGKSFVLHVMATLTRMVVGMHDACLAGAPTGIAANVAGGLTWHSLLSIPAGSERFHRSFVGRGGSPELQQNLCNLFTLLGDETSMTGRTLFGWIANQLRLNVARGAGSAEPDAGECLPFWVQAGDFFQLGPVMDTSLLSNEFRKPNSNTGRQVFQLFTDVIVLSETKRQDASQRDLRDLIGAMRRGASADEYNREFVLSRHLSRLPPDERLVFTLPRQGTLCVYPTWDDAWLKRNLPMLKMLNQGYASPNGDRVEGVPVYKIRSTSSGRCATCAKAVLFQGIPVSTYCGRGSQIRLTVNLYGKLGQQWGLVNSALGEVVEVIYPTAEAAADELCVPLVVARFQNYTGPAFCAARPKLVLLPAVERTGDCRCQCKRLGPCFRIAEGTTFHAVQGITSSSQCHPATGEKQHQIQRVGLSPGDKKVEARNPGTTLVGQSRPATAKDFCFMEPVSIDRLAVAGRNKHAETLRARMARHSQNQSLDAAKLLGFYEPLLHWAIRHAKAEHGIDPPWEQATSAPPQAPPTVSSRTASSPAPAFPAASLSGFFDLAAAVPRRSSAPTETRPGPDRINSAAPSPPGAMALRDVAQAGSPLASSSSSLGRPASSATTSRYFPTQSGETLPHTPLDHPLPSTAGELQAIPRGISKRQCVQQRPLCAVSLRTALLGIHRRGHTLLTLDELMKLLAGMRKTAAGLCDRDVVERALHWLTTNDTFCTYLPEASRGELWCIRFTI